MGDHVNTKKSTAKHHKRGFAESSDIDLQRANRVTFKHYIQQLEDDLLESELLEEEWVVERGVRDGDETMWIEVDSFKSEQEAQECADDYEKNELGRGDQYRIRQA
jgi:hypothetical protein